MRERKGGREREEGRGGQGEDGMLWGTPPHS